MCHTLYIGEQEFNIRLDNHSKGVHTQNTPQPSQHFKLPNYNFNQHAKFTLIEQLVWLI